MIFQQRTDHCFNCKSLLPSPQDSKESITMVETVLTTEAHACNRFNGMKPTLAMVVVQITFAGVSVLYKLAINDGMNPRVIIAYRFVFAAAFMVPLALIVERNNMPKFSWMLLAQASLCGLLGGTLAQNLFLESLALTSPTFMTAIFNLVPAITFILAVSFGLERLNLGSAAGKAKTIGTLIGIGGAMLMTFYKGVPINIFSTHINLLNFHHHLQTSDHQHSSSSSTSSHHLLGALFGIASCGSYASWLIIQTKMSQKYPSHYTNNALMCLMGALQSTLFALCMERDTSQWRLGWDLRLLTVAYAGIVASGVMTTLIAWCVTMRGPLFASVFNPLMLVIVAIASSLVLEERLHLGSVLGAVLIVCGLYFVLWGKSKEMKKISQAVASSCSHESVAMEVVVMSTTDVSDVKGCHVAEAAAK